MKNSFLLLMIAFAVLIVSSLSVSAQTCMISTGVGHPLLPDTDCDRVIDMEDNCPFITNPMQRDADGNGLGDACDLYIESIGTSPSDFVYNGRAFNTIATLYNHRDYNLRNVKVRVIMPELGIESVQYIDNIEVCSSETIQFFLRAPACVQNGDYRIIVEASFMNMFGDEEIIPGITSIRMVPDQYCQSILNNNQIIGNTIIDVMEIQDVYKGYEAVFPVRISNTERIDKDYVFTITGLEGWGSARIEPGSVVIVPEESMTSVNIFVKANDDAPASCLGYDCGSKPFLVTVQSGKEVQSFVLIANVKESGKNDNSFLLLFSLKVLLIGGLVLLLIIALIIGMVKFMASARSDNMEYY
ncbi:thrombospondin type 3 repeat-containing protein [Candidatus Woesearchaeota archaeon]|nr:thrombospondin type 3 repeat-containing protein [Candidatus Woesearchaeota archaeon]